MYGLLDNVDNADELDIDNLMNDSDTEYMLEEEIQTEKEKQDTSIITLEANTNVGSTDPQKQRTEKEG